MKRFPILLALLLALILPVAVSAQTAITTFTLSAAVTNPAPTTVTLTVSSATGMSVGSVLYVDGSVYRITAISGTTITVTTAFRPATHLTSAAGFIVPLAAQIGIDPVGSCLRSTAGRFPAYSPYTLMFNLSNGNIAMCQGAVGSRTWVIVNPYGVGAKSANPPQTP